MIEEEIYENGENQLEKDYEERERKRETCSLQRGFVEQTATEAWCSPSLANTSSTPNTDLRSNLSGVIVRAS